jgi:L-fuconolactonase
MAAIAQESAACCKLSGLLTEAGKNWREPDLIPYVAHLFEHFGPERLIWGSDWPVLTIAASYETWLELASGFIPKRQETAAVFGANAADLYKLSKVPATKPDRAPSKMISSLVVSEDG